LRGLVESRDHDFDVEVRESRVRHVHVHRALFNARRQDFAHVGEVTARDIHIDVSGDSSTRHPSVNVEPSARRFANVASAQCHLSKVRYTHLTIGIQERLTIRSARIEGNAGSPHIGGHGARVQPEARHSGIQRVTRVLRASVGAAETRKTQRQDHHQQDPVHGIGTGVTTGMAHGCIPFQPHVTQE